MSKRLYKFTPVMFDTDFSGILVLVEVAPNAASPTWGCRGTQTEDEGGGEY